MNKLSWNDETSIGYVENSHYTELHEFRGTELKPNLGFNYETLNYDDEMDNHFIIINGVPQEMSSIHKAAALKACIEFVDPNDSVAPSIDELRSDKWNEIRTVFDFEVNKLSLRVLPQEMASWTKQEAEARAWDVDNSVETPMIDGLLVSRGLSETKQELVDKIITKADLYIVAYADLLGRWQRVERLLEAADSEADLDGIEL